MTRSLVILHQDRRVLFVDKPPKMMAVPAPGVTDKGRSLEEFVDDEHGPAFAVHRLDYETSGVMTFARDEEMRDALIDLFRRREVRKTYLALVEGHIEKHQGVFDDPIQDLGVSARIAPHGRPAVTHYSVLRHIGGCTLVRVRPETGRHNQIRLHFAHARQPLVGERKYAKGRDAILPHRRVLLHAETLRLSPPHVDHDLNVKAALPADFEEALVRAETETSARTRHTSASRAPKHRRSEQRASKSNFRAPGKTSKTKNRRRKR